MNLSDYFASNDGTGVLSTANKNGAVNSAIYSKPHVTGPEEVSFIMLNKKTRANLLENPGAHYLFVEKGDGYKGVRISLTMTAESDDQEVIGKLSRRHSASKSEKYLVSFKVDQVIELIGDEDLVLE